MRLRTRLWVLFVFGLVLATAGGIAYATIPDSDGVIHGCYSKGTGVLRVVDPSLRQECSGEQTAISWNQQGPQGEPGAPGEPGPRGPTGQQGQAGPSDAFSVEQAN